MDEPADDATWQRLRVERACSFGATAAEYAALRPSWPAATAHWLVGEPGVGQRLRVLDLGAGTGKLTATLVGLGHDVLAVDPDAAMVDALREAVPGVEVSLGSAEAIPAPDAAFDAITVAQAWHWFDEAAAAAECARVLRPGGVLGVGWHRRDESLPWLREVSVVAGRMEDVRQVPRAEIPVFGTAFDPAISTVLDYQLVTTPAGFQALADTWSYVRLGERRQATLDAVLALALAAADPPGAPDGRLVVPHHTLCYRARRR